MTEGNRNGTQPPPKRMRQHRRVWLLLSIAFGFALLAFWISPATFTAQAQDRDPPQVRNGGTVVQAGSFGLPQAQELRPVRDPRILDDFAGPGINAAQRSPRDNRYSSFAESSTLKTSPSGNENMRPVTETSYRDVVYSVTVPVTDPATGKVTMTTQTKTRKVPVQVQRWVPAMAAPIHPQTHDPKVHQIVAQLRGTRTTDANKSEVDKQLTELRQLLDTEFKKKHDKQAAEIAATEKRIADLKAVHEQRGENQSQIVQRRIDQLLGKSNPLDWDVGVPMTGVAAPQPWGGVLPFANPVPGGYPATFGRQIPEEDSRGRDERSPNRDFRDSNAPLIGQESQDWYDLRSSPLVDSEPSSFAQRPVEVEESPISRVSARFNVVAQVGEAMLLAEAKKDELAESKRLFEDGLMPAIELRKAELAYATAKQRAAVLALQVNSMRRELQEEVDIAKTQVNEGNTSLHSLAGSASQSERATIERAVREAKSRAERGNRELNEFKAALREVGMPDDPSELKASSPQQSVQTMSDSPAVDRIPFGVPAKDPPQLVDEPVGE